MSELNYHATNYFTKTLLGTKMRKTQIFMNKPVYLGLSISDISKTVLYEFYYDYEKPKNSENVVWIWIQTVSLST